MQPTGDTAPRTAEPDTPASDTVDSEADGSDAEESGTVESHTAESDTVESDAGESDAPESETEAADAEVADSEVTDSEVTDSETTGSGVTESEVGGVAESEDAASDVAENDVTSSAAETGDAGSAAQMKPTWKRPTQTDQMPGGRPTPRAVSAGGSPPDSVVVAAPPEIDPPGKAPSREQPTTYCRRRLCRGWFSGGADSGREDHRPRAPACPVVFGYDRISRRAISDRPAPTTTTLGGRDGFESARYRSRHGHSLAAQFSSGQCCPSGHSAAIRFRIEWR